MRDLNNSESIYVSRLDSVFDTRPRKYPLSVIFKEIQTGAASLANLAEDTPYRTLAQVTDRARELRYQRNNLEAYEVLKREMPQIIPAGVLTTRSKIDKFSSVVCLEWDGDVDTDHALVIGKQHPNVLAIWRSLSRKPKFLVPINLYSRDGDLLSTDNYKHAWYSVSCFFEEIGDADVSAMTPTQPQALCYDPDLFVNWDATPVNWDIDDEALEEAHPNASDVESCAYASLPDEYHTAIAEMEWEESGWGKTSVPCPFGGNHANDGWGYRSNGTSIRKNGANDFTFHCFKCSQTKRFSEPKQLRHTSLTITGDAKETFGTLTDNTNALITAFTNALADSEPDNPHYHLLHFEMGSGKNHSLLTSLATLKKRGIGIFENHEQVDEQALNASLMGLMSAKLRGRGYKFDQSGLRSMDIQARRLYDNVFQRHPDVMCAFYDVIEKREEKGLAPYQYCLDCPFYKEKSCPYINQFIGVSEVDFVATCMHDLFFDPNFRHLLAGLWRTPEESEAETIIGEALGVAPKEASDFDIGILDEVIARNLYLDYTYSFQDLFDLVNAWEGEPLADFLTTLLDSLNDRKSEPLGVIQKHIETLSEDLQKMIANQMTLIPEDVEVYAHTLRDKATKTVLSESYIEEPSGTQRSIPVSKEAEVTLREKEVPVRPYRKIAPKTKIGVSPYRGIGVSPDEVAGRLWTAGWTLLHQLQKAIHLDIAWVGTKYNLKGEQVCCDTFTITVPPQVSTIANRLILMGGTMDVENIITAFEGQSVRFTTSTGIPARYAKGVSTYQLTDRRLTYRSVFKVETDVNGKMVFDDDTGKPIVKGLTTPAETELETLCTLAETHIADGNPKPVFISYKDFTKPPVSDFPLVERMQQCLQVKHFDLTRGLNFDDVKVFIVYGLPKSARPDIVKETAEILHHTELPENPLDTTYERGSETHDGYKVENIGSYLDTRMEAVRQQLTRDKSKQALYRARPTRWQDTITLHFSAEPIPDWTERATGFVRTDLQQVKRFEDMGRVINRRETAEKNGDVKGLAKATGQSERTARRHTQNAREQSKTERDTEIFRRYADGESKKGIATALNISQDTVARVLKKAPF